MSPEERGIGGDARGQERSDARGAAAQMAGAVAERCSTALGFLLIALWAALAPRHAARRIPDRMRQTPGPVGLPAWEPLPAARREQGLSLSGSGFGRT